MTQPGCVRACGGVIKKVGGADSLSVLVCVFPADCCSKQSESFSALVTFCRTSDQLGAVFFALKIWIIFNTLTHAHTCSCEGLKSDFDSAWD